MTRCPHSLHSRCDQPRQAAATFARRRFDPHLAAPPHLITAPPLTGPDTRLSAGDRVPSWWASHGIAASSKWRSWYGWGVPGLQVSSVALIGEGVDHLAYEVNGELVVRFSKEDD